MLKACSRILLVLCPLLFILGMFRIVINGENSFLPTSEEFLESLISMPNVMQVIRDSVYQINTGANNVVLSFRAINNIFDFFSAMGTFFQLIGIFGDLILSTLLGVVQWFIWLFKFLFGL